VAPCPPPLSQAEREARPPPPALQRSPKRVRAEGIPRGSKPQTSSRQLPETALITSGNRGPRAQLPEPANPQPGGCRPVKEELPRHTGSADRGQDIIPHEMRPIRTANNRPRAAATTTPTPGLEPEKETTPPQGSSNVASATPSAPPAATAPSTRRSARQANLRALQTADHVRQYETEDAVDVGNRPLRVLVLFSGSGSVESAIRTLYPNNVVDIVSVDSDPKSAATLVTDINEFVREQLFTWRPGHFDILWASPPCTQ
jgi:hypothetical protein